MASLVRREVLVMQTDPRSPERGQYEFVQALVRTIAYETIGRRERKRRHKAAAEYLEALGGEELSEVIAAHYVDAYRLAPDDDDAEQLRDQAKRGLLRAVERARSLAATGEAERLMRAAIELTEDPAERAQLLEEAGQLTLADGRPGDAIAQFAEADELLRELGELHGAARLRARQAEALFLEGRTDESVALMEPAYSVLRDQEQDADLAALASQYARMLGFVDRLDESIEPLERAIEIAEQLRRVGDAVACAEHEGAGIAVQRAVRRRDARCCWARCGSPRRRTTIRRRCARTSTCPTWRSGRIACRAATINAAWSCPGGSATATGSGRS